MYIIGQNINTSSLSVREMLENRDRDALLALAEVQIKKGADLLDVNADQCRDAAQALLWAVKTLEGHPLMIDSAHAGHIALACEGSKPQNGIINSISLDEKKIDTLLPLAQAYKMGVVAMPVAGMKLLDSNAQYIESAGRLLELLHGAGISDEKIYMDIIVLPAYLEDGPEERAALLRRAYPGIHIIAGISNVSHGMRDRLGINRAFARRCLQSGVDSFILDALGGEPAALREAERNLREQI